MDNELKISKERVLKAANECITARGALKTLFPEVFEEEDKYFDLSDLSTNDNKVFNYMRSKSAGFDNNEFMQVRFSGKYRGKAFYLQGAYKWELVYDEFGCLCLLPTKRK